MGQFRGVAIEVTPKKKKLELKSNIVSGLSVFLGNIRKYYISEQPFIYTLEIMRYDEAKMKYG